FSSRRRHTRCLSDWSSDVCSSDLSTPPPVAEVVVNAYVLTAEGGVERQEVKLLIECSLGQVSVPHPEVRREMLLLSVARAREEEIGRASCRERGRRSVGSG